MGFGKGAFLKRLYSRVKLFQSTTYSEKLEGSSPPSVFIGRIGYPKVQIGPLIPQISGDTRVLDSPETWLEMNMKSEDIVNFRLQLVRGKQAVGIKDQSRFTEQIREIALSNASSDVEATFKYRPQGVFLHEDIQPFGPSAPLKDLRTSTSIFENHLEKAYNDTDLTAKEAVVNLYNENVSISGIQRALSVGALGIGKNRKLVPTRWSITAVDSTLSEHLLDEVKTFPIIEECRVYETMNLNNRFLVILFPSLWQYEWVEAFFPQVIGDKLEIFSDNEDFERKKGYSKVGGCYYSARFAVTERLAKEQKQAGVVILREAYSNYIPLGVFNVRENMRLAMKGSYARFDNFDSALQFTLSRLRIPSGLWKEHSKLLQKRTHQTSLMQFQQQIH